MTFSSSKHKTFALTFKTNELILLEKFQNSEEMFQFFLMQSFNITTHIIHLEYLTLDTLGNYKSKKQTEIWQKFLNTSKFSF